MWEGKKVSVIFPTYNEKDSIRGAINDFFKSGLLDEILVVNNNAAEGTKEEVEKTKARQVFETKQGYGYAIRRGFKEVKGDLIIIAEPDGTFLGKDVIKLLAYSDDVDVVFGTRTHTAMIQKGANMGMFIKWGNWFVAKIMQFLFNTDRFSDAGCTMRLLSRKALEKIEPKFVNGGSNFGLEMMLHIINIKITYLEVPLTYEKRVGESSVTGSKVKAFILGLDMIWLVFSYRMKTLFKRFF